MTDAWADFRDAPAGAQRAYEWDALRAPALPPASAAKPSVAADVARALSIDAAKGAIGLAGLPGIVQEMSNSLFGLDHKVMDATGFSPQAGTSERVDSDRYYTGIGIGFGDTPRQQEPIAVSTPEEPRRLPSGTLIFLPDRTVGRVP